MKRTYLKSFSMQVASVLLPLLGVVATSGLAQNREAREAKDIYCPHIAAKEIVEAAAVMHYLQEFDRDEIPSSPNASLLTREDLEMFGLEDQDLLSTDEVFSFQVAFEGITSQAGDAVFLVRIARQGCLVHKVAVLSEE